MRVPPGLSLELDYDLINAVLHECKLQFYHFVSFVIFEKFIQQKRGITLIAPNISLRREHRLWQ